MTVPNAAQARTYPLPAPAEDRRFTLGLVFEVIEVLTGHGYPEITAGADLVDPQQALYGFLYQVPEPGIDREAQALRGSHDRHAQKTHIDATSAGWTCAECGMPMDIDPFTADCPRCAHGSIR